MSQLDQSLFNSLSTAIILLNCKNNKFSVEDMNNAAIETIGLDKKGLNIGLDKLSELSPSLAELFKQIINENNDHANKKKRIEVYINGQYLNAYITQYAPREFILELYKIMYKDISQTTHELKRPIQNIKTLIETLLMGAKDDADLLTKYLTNINYESDRLVRLVNDILRLSSLNNGSIKVKKVPVNLKNSVDKVLASLKVKAAEKSLKVVNSVDQKIKISADEELLGHLLENLIDNAIKYNKENGSLFIEAISDSQITLTVRDTGMGIPEEDLNKICDQFYRVKSTQNIPGSGLGLTIVKSIVELHKGSLTIESKVNQGTSFTIKMPVS